MDEVKHFVDGLPHLLFLRLGVTRTTVFKHIVKVLFRVGIHIERDVGGQRLHQFHFPQSGLCKPINIAQHILVDLARRLGHHDKIVIVEVDLPIQVIDGLFYKMRQVRIIL